MNKTKTVNFSIEGTPSTDFASSPTVIKIEECKADILLVRSEVPRVKITEQNIITEDCRVFQAEKAAQEVLTTIRKHTTGQKKSEEENPTDYLSKAESATEEVPYDRGWGWMVVLGCFINYMMFVGYLKCSSILFVQLIKVFKAPASQAALLLGIRAAAFSLTGFCVMNVLINRIQFRKLVLTGALLLPLSLISSSFMRDLISLICLQAILCGMGMATLLAPGEVLACSYFQRRRSLALALAKCGASAGAVSMPPLFNFLTEQYGLRGALLLMGGICLHTIPATLLLRPTSSFSKMPGRPQQSSSDHGVKMSGSERGLTGDASTGPEGMTSLALDAAQVEMIVAEGEMGKRAAKTTPSVQRSRHEMTPDATCNTRHQKVFSGRKSLSESALSEGNKVHQLLSDKVTRDTAANTQFSQRRFFPGISTSRSQCIVGKEGKHSKSGMRSFSSVTTSQTLWQRSDDVSKKWHPIKASRSKALDSPCFAKGARHLPEESSKQRLTKFSHPNTGSDFLEKFSSSLVVKTLSSSAVDLGSASLMSQYKIESRGLTSMTKHETDSQEPEKLKAERLKSKQPEEAQNATSDRFEQSRPADAPRASPKSTWDFSLLWQPQFRLLLVYFMLSPFASLAIDYLPAAAVEKGISEARASLLLSIIGGLDLFSRLASGIVANLRIVNVRTMIIGCFFVIGFVNQCVRFLESFPTFVGVAVVMGLLGGVPTSLATVLVIEVVGVERLGHAIAFVQVFYGGSMAAFYPLIGYIRDKTGSYDLAYHVVGCGVLGAAGFLCCGGWSAHCAKPDKFVTHYSDETSGEKNK